MFVLSFLRAIKFSLQDIARNFWLTAATVIILVLALFLVNLLIAVQTITQSAINSVKEKIDVSLDMKDSAQDSEILALKAQVSNLENVKSVDYVTKTQALEAFKIKNGNKPQVLEAIRELNKNPLNATLIIKPMDIDQYDKLISELNQIDNSIIDSKNFDNPKVMLNKINSITKKIDEIGLFVSLIFILITILVVYNSIRVTIYTHQKEIGIMKLVGASNWFIKAPFLISAVAYTFFGLVITIGLFYPFLGLLQPYLETFFSGYTFNILTFFNSKFITIFGLEFLIATLVNVLASFIAVRKYSKV